MKMYNKLAVALTTEEFRAINTVLTIVADIAVEMEDGAEFKGDKTWTEQEVDIVCNFLEDLHYNCEKEE